MGQRRSGKVKRRKDRKKRDADKKARRAARPFFEVLDQDGDIVTARVAGRRIKYHAGLAASLAMTANMALAPSHDAAE